MQTDNPGDAAVPVPARRRWLIWLIALLVIVLAAILGARWWLVGRFHQSTDDAYVGGNVAVISPRVSGYVQRILVEDNAYVRAGQPLLRLDPAVFEARLAEARAKAAAAQASVGRLQAQHALVLAEVTRAQAQLDVALAAAGFANDDAQRYAQMAQARTGTLQDAQRSRSAQRQAQAQQRAAEAALVAQRRQLAVVDAQAVEAQAALTQAQAALHDAELQLGYTTLYAPVDGYVGNRSAHPGTFVAAGTQLLSLVPASGLWVDANFKEDQIHAMRPGQRVSIEADVAPDLQITGHVVSLAPATGAVFSVIPAQNATGNFTKIVQRVPVRIALDRQAATLGVLRPGLSVTPTVDTQSAP